MREKVSQKEETRVRVLLVSGIALSLAAYLLFFWTGPGWAFVWPLLVACAGLATSFYGIWSWNMREKAKWLHSASGQDGHR